MSEEIDGKKVFTLFEVMRSIRKTLNSRYRSAYWIKAELNKLNYYSHSGHCYPELVEKQDQKIIAQIRSQLWRDDFQRVNQNFIRTLNEPLKDGIKILFLAEISFHPVYGISLNILDINPSYTLGDLEKEKKETIRKLQSEKLFDKNKQLKLPLLPQRIAIISVETSKGYADFIRVIEAAEKTWSYKFFHFLFPSLLQGDQAVRSITAQLERIKKVRHHFDLVAIIRGGGGDIGLSCYNHYDLAHTITEFPIPVVTGIGHATNETVSEMVAYENAITPTKLAEWLIQQFHNFSEPVRIAREKITDRAKYILEEENRKFENKIKLFQTNVKHTILTNNQIINDCSKTLFQHSNFILKNAKDAQDAILLNVKRNTDLYIKNMHTELTHAEKNIQIMSPDNVLKRGYSITYVRGKSLTSAQKVKAGDIVITKLYQGSFTSTINEISKTEHNE